MLPLAYPPALEARYNTVPAISSSTPILCAGTRVRGITPPVCSHALVTGAVMSEGNPEENDMLARGSIVLSYLWIVGLIRVIKTEKYSQPGAITLHLTSNGTKCAPRFFIKWCTAALLAL
jgi:hypothetical protein